jgi:class 3 adenylate cyclase
MAHVVTERILECSSDACTLWTVITDTDRTNRAIGLARLELSPLSDSSAARYLVRTHLGGFPVEYEERPFEWVYLDHFKILRRMRSGPFEWIELGFQLAPTDLGGTRLTTRLSIAPRFAILSPILRYQASQSLARIAKEILSVDASLAAGRPPHAVRKASAHAGALARALRALEASVAPPLARRLADHVRDADDADVARVRPFELADTWDVPRRDVLEACLRAVGAGMLELRWEIVCPSCRTAADTIPSLAQLGEHGSCQLCDIEFAVDLDQAVEATFTPTRAVRDVDNGPYCVGGPARTPHVVAQSVLPPRGRAALVVPREEGSYRLFVRGGAAERIDVREGAPVRIDMDAASVGAGAPRAEPLAVAPGGTIEIASASAEETHAKIERATWARKAATAREVTAMPGFRRQFSSDTLRPGVALKVSRVGLFFSDLTGSTALYSSAGDAAAFRLVHDHFEVITGILEKSGGTLVKTIGDAVMAAFNDDLDGLVASLAILRAFEAFRQHGELHGRTHIKLGVFGGPCYVVTANGVLDYFGQTANIAARLQSEAHGGEVVVEASLADHAIRSGVLDPALVRERYPAALKGVDQPIEVARISLSRSA